MHINPCERETKLVIPLASALSRSCSNFFIPKRNGSAVNSSPANHLCIFSVLRKCQNESPGNSGCFPY